MKSWHKSFVTLSLAALYALIASCGHSFHCHGGNCHGAACHDIACQESTCHDTNCQTACSQNPSCCEGGHFFELRASLADCNKQASSKEATSSKEAICRSHDRATFRTISSSEETLSLAECFACQLLSQLEVGYVASASHAGAWLTLSHPPLVNDSQTTNTIDQSFDARGPPNRC